MKFEAADLSSDNIIGVLPGSDPALSQEYIVVSAAFGHWLRNRRALARRWNL